MKESIALLLKKMVCRFKLRNSRMMYLMTTARIFRVEYLFIFLSYSIKIMNFINQNVDFAFFLYYSLFSCSYYPKAKGIGPAVFSSP